MINKTPLNFIKEKGILEEYRMWRGYSPPKDRKEYYRMWYIKKKEAMFKDIK